MSIAAALLLIGACGSASRTMTVDASIEQIVVRCVIGGVKDVALQVLRRGTVDGFGSRFADMRSLSDQLTRVRLRIDGRERTGVFAWLAAAHRVAGYAIDRSEDRVQASKVHGGSGSVEYSYRLRVRGFDIRRSTRISDGRVSLLTDVYGRIGPRGELNHVSLVLRATESTTARTTITGSAMGETTIGIRCRLVRRIAERAIADGLDRELLARIQRGGIDLYRAGAIVEAMK